MPTIRITADHAASPQSPVLSDEQITRAVREVFETGRPVQMSISPTSRVVVERHSCGLAPECCITAALAEHWKSAARRRGDALAGLDVLPRECNCEPADDARTRLQTVARA